MIDKLFRIDFYPKDWLIDTARLTPEERGIYIQIVCMIYANRGPIENDAKWIAGQSGCSTRKAKKIISELFQKKILIENGSKISQKRAENELETKREHLENSSKGGQNSAEKKRKNKENKDLASSGTTYPQHTPIATATVPLSPSPIVDVVSAGARKHVEVGKQISEITGWENDPRWFGDYSRIEVWLKSGWCPEKDIIPTVQRIMAGRTEPPGSMKYFEKAIADCHVARTTPVPKGENHGQKLTKSQRIDAELREFLERPRD